MQQNSGFENRHIDTYLPQDVLHYAPVFKPSDSISTAFPGIKTAPFSSDSQGEELSSSAGVILPVALLLAAFLLVFLKNTLKSSVGSLFLVGLSPKSLQETERRQIERNTLIISLINAISFFSIALILYAVYIRFQFLFPSFEPPYIPNYLRYLTLFLSITIVIFLFFYARSRCLALFGEVFSASTILKGYQKPHKLLFVSLSPVLLLVAAFTAFAPFTLMSFVSFFLLICISAYYIIFVVVSLSKFLNFTNRFTIHIFLYLCTLEILPILILVKLTQNVYF